MLVDLDPYLVRLGGFGIRWYGFFMAVSMALGFYFFLKHGRRLGFREEFLYNVAVISLATGVVGARAIYVLTNWGDYAAQPGEIWRIDHGGLSWHGGLLGGVVAGWLYVHSKRSQPASATEPGTAAAAAGAGAWVGMLADLAVPGLCIGYILVRIGNIFNQEVLGRTGALLPFDRHPAQLYGSAIGLILLALHNRLARSHPPAGYLFWAWFFFYSLLRGVVEETFRANPLYVVHYVNADWGFGFTTMTQLATPVLALFAYAMMRAARRGRPVAAPGKGRAA